MFLFFKLSYELKLFTRKKCMIRALYFPSSYFIEICGSYKNNDFEIASRVKKFVESSKIKIFEISILQ